MTIIYRVDLENNTGSTVAIFNNFLNLSYTTRVGKKGNYTLTISGFDDRRLLFEDDSIVRVWMKDESQNIPWTNTFNGIHKTYTNSLEQNGTKRYTSFGPDSMELIDKARILYPAGSSGANKSGVASTVIYSYIDENIGANATTANGREDDHTNPITNAVDPFQGPTWDGAEPWQELLKAISKIRDYSINQNDQIDYRVDYLGSYAWEFKAGVLGVDRTAVGVTSTSNGLNGAGNVPVIFGPSFGNVDNFIKSESRYSESNSITVIGQGTDSTRDTATETDTTQATRSAIAKRERVINANNIPKGDTASLTARALSSLDQYKATEKVRWKSSRGSQILFRDYNIGDFITAEDFDGVRTHKQVIEGTITVQPTTNALIERQQLKFSDL